MRITCLYDIKHDFHNTRKKIKESLLEDIESLAESQLDSEFKRFAIQIRLKPIEEEYH